VLRDHTVVNICSFSGFIHHVCGADSPLKTYSPNLLLRRVHVPTCYHWPISVHWMVFQYPVTYVCVCVCEGQRARQRGTIRTCFRGRNVTNFLMVFFLIVLYVYMCVCVCVCVLLVCVVLWQSTHKKSSSKGSNRSSSRSRGRGRALIRNRNRRRRARASASYSMSDSTVKNLVNSYKVSIIILC